MRFVESVAVLYASIIVVTEPIGPPWHVVPTVPEANLEPNSGGQTGAEHVGAALLTQQ